MQRAVALLLSFGVLLFASHLFASRAAAGGYELPGGSARSVGRGGAYAARADDHTALILNPAALASHSGTRIGLDASALFLSMCFDAAGDYVDDINSESFSRFGDPEGWALLDKPPVCNDAFPAVVPEIGFTTSLAPGLGVGVGLFAPFAVGNQTFGDPDDYFVTASAAAPSGHLPAPSRYLLTSSEIYVLQPTIGVGWAPIPALELGVSFQWGISILNLESMTVALAGQIPELDIYTRASAQDFFVPGAIASARFIPIDNLEIMGGFKITDDVRAGGHLELTHGVYGTSMPGSTAPTPTRIEGIEIEAPLTWTGTLALRYADRIAPRPKNPAAVERLTGSIEDPMTTEWWDIELDVVYEMSSRLDDLVVTLPADPSARVLQTTPVGSDGTPGSMPLPIPEEFILPHRWKDQLSVRLGGDYNVVPGLASVRLGGSFETSGLDERYTALLFHPTQRIGVHGGLTVRINRFDISLAYAHFFQESVEVSEMEARYQQISADRNGDIVNAGRFESDVDVLSLGILYHP